MSSIIGYAKPYVVAEKVKSILKIHGDYSFFALPTDILQKYNVDSFEIIKKDNKIMLIGSEVSGQSRPTENTAVKRGSNIDN